MSHLVYTAYRVEGLTAPQKAVFVNLSIHAETESGEAWPSNTTIANETSLSIRSVQNAIKYLMEAKLINVQLEGIKGSGKQFFETRRIVTFNPTNWKVPDDQQGRQKINANDPDLLNGVIRLVRKR